MYGITTPLGFYKSSMRTLKAAFRSVVGYHWWLRLHGWEADDRQFGKRSIGHSHALYVPYKPGDNHLNQILCQLVEKMGRRLRGHNLKAGGLHVGCLFSDYSYWHQGRKLEFPLFVSLDFYKKALEILSHAPVKPVRILSISGFRLSESNAYQLQLFESEDKKRILTTALDALSDRWGDFTVVPGVMLNMKKKVLDRIAFGSVGELEEFVFREQI
jgi:DNA polymerase-4